jgi:hypothetical protein
LVIGGHRQRLTTVPEDLLGDAIEGGLIAGGHEHLRAQLGQAQGGGPADATRRAHHDSDLLRQWQH